jgi:hypothetical protein
MQQRIYSLSNSPIGHHLSGKGTVGAVKTSCAIIRGCHNLLDTAHADSRAYLRYIFLISSTLHVEAMSSAVYVNAVKQG